MDREATDSLHKGNQQDYREQEAKEQADRLDEDTTNDPIEEFSETDEYGTILNTLIERN